MLFVLMCFLGLNEPSSHVAETKYFAFHSDVHLNLHHFLFLKAQLDKGKRVDKYESPSKWDAMFDKTMTDAESAIWQKALRYYDKQFGENSLLFNRRLNQIKNALVEGDFEHAAIGAELRGLWEAALPIYRQHWWLAHDRANRNWVAEVLQQVKQHEQPIIQLLEAKYTEPWLKNRCRIDLTVYGDFYGAYTTNFPTHVIIGAYPYDSDVYDKLELVFHEPSHGIIGRRSGKISAAMKSHAQAMNLKIPRNLWHAILFYTTGWATQKRLAQVGTDYELMMKRKQIFTSYHTALDAHWLPYLEGQITMDEALTTMLKEFAKAMD